MGAVIHMEQNDNLVARIMRAEAIRKAVSDQNPFPSQDQHQAAHNLHRLISRAKQTPGFEIGKVLARVGLGGNGDTDSTKRLDTYTLPNVEDDRRKARIAKKPGKFLELAEVLAKSLNEPAAVVVSQVFEGCSYATKQLPKGDWESENWARLTQLINSMARAVIRDHDVEAYWQKARMTNGGYDLATGRFLETSQGIGGLFDNWGLAGDVVWSGETAPVPSIPLARRLQGDQLSGAVSFEGGFATEATFRFWLDIRLALGPVNEPTSIGPLIEFRTALEAELDDGRIACFDYPVIDHVETPDFAVIDGESYRVDHVELTADADAPPAMFREDALHSYIVRSELSPALLRSLLDPDSDAHITQDLCGLTLGHGGFPPIRFSKTSAIGAINEALLNGKLEAELGAECDRLAAGLDALRVEQGKKIRIAEAEALARWTSHTASKSQKKGDQQ